VQSCSASDSLHYMGCSCSHSDKSRSMIYFAVLCRVRSNRLPTALSWTRIPTRSGRTGRVEQIALRPGPGDPGRGKALTPISFFFNSTTPSFVCLNLLSTPIYSSSALSSVGSFHKFSKQFDERYEQAVAKRMSISKGLVARTKWEMQNQVVIVSPSGVWQCVTVCCSVL